jgi:hypothetical protein
VALHELGESGDIRILVALEDDYRAYREVIAVGVQVHRPHTEVTSVGLEELEEEVTRLDPDVVISSVAGRAGSGERPAWVKLSLDPARPSMVWVGGRYSERVNPGLEALLEVVDEAERLSTSANTGHSEGPQPA